MGTGYGQPQTNQLPTPEVTTGPEYAEELNAAIQELIDTKTAQVTPAGIDLGNVYPDLDHATREIAMGPTQGIRVAGTGTAPTSSAMYWLNTSGLGLTFEPVVPVGKRAIGASLFCRPNGVGQTWTISVYVVNQYGTQTLLGTETSSTGASDETVNIDSFTSHQLAAGEHLQIYVSTPSAAATPRAYKVRLFFDQELYS